MRHLIIVVALSLLLANPVAAYRDQLAEHATWLRDVDAWNVYVMQQASGVDVIHIPGEN